jgi:TonB family protein
MRPTILATLVLIPVLAHAQASTTTTQAPVAATTLVAKATPPAPKPDATPAKPAVHESVRERVEAFYLDTPSSRDSADTYLLMGDDHADNAPKLVHVVETEVPQDLITAPVTTSVRMMVDSHGVPSHITVEKSAGAQLDEKTIEAVQQYRFKPATVNHIPVDAEVTVDIKIQKL